MRRGAMGYGNEKHHRPTTQHLTKDFHRDSPPLHEPLRVRPRTLPGDQNPAQYALFLRCNMNFAGTGRGKTAHGNLPGGDGKFPIC